MMKPCLTSLSCPDWPLERIASGAEEWGFEGVELRTFGADGRLLASDPALTLPAKTRQLFDSAGVEVLCLATSCRFDEPIWPPVIGSAIRDQEQEVRAAKRAIDLAAALGCPFVRVYAFNRPPREKRDAVVRRIVGRLANVVDHARNTGVRVVVENGGGFRSAADLAEIITAVQSPLLGACYSLAPGADAGDTARGAVETLGTRLWAARIQNLRGADPVPLVDPAGELPCREFVAALAESGFDGPLMIEWERLWRPDLAPAEEVVPGALSRVFEWMAESATPARGPRRSLAATA